MIIDSHTHLGRNNHIKGNAKELLKSMDAAKIDKALVFAGTMNDCPNEWLLEQVKKHRDRLYPVLAYEHPYWHAVDMEKMAKDHQVAGIKFYTGYEHYYPLDLYHREEFHPAAMYHNPLQLCSDMSIPAIFHCGDCLNSVKQAKLKYAHPLNIDEAAVDYDDVNFIIAHVGYPWVKDTAEVCYKNANVYTDISGFVYGKFEREDQLKFEKMLTEFLSISGTDKLLFGTDWPICDQSSYRESLEWVASVTQDSKLHKCLTAEYMTQNTKRIFNLS